MDEEWVNMSVGQDSSVGLRALGRAEPRSNGGCAEPPVVVRVVTVVATLVSVVVLLSLVVATASGAALGSETHNQSVDESGTAATTSGGPFDRWTLDESESGVDSSVANATGEVTALVVLDEQFRLSHTEGDPGTLKSATEAAQQPVIEELSATDGVTVTDEFWLVNVLTVTVDTDVTDPGALADVPGVHTVARPQGLEHPTPPDPPASNVSTAGRDELTYGLEMVNVPAVWEQFDTRGEGTSVAVVDDGVDPDHPDIDLEEGLVFDGDGPTGAPMTPESGHGMHTSATVAGGNASGTWVGVAPNTELYHIDVFSEADGLEQISALIRSAEWSVEQDVDVVSMSVGLPGYLMALIPIAGNANALGTSLVTSAGNDGESPVLNTVPSPANEFNSVSVGAVNETGTVAEFSSGGVIESDAFVREETRRNLGWPEQFTVPDIAAPGVDVFSAWLDDGYAEVSGTSMAAPHVAGAVALVQAATEERLAVETIEAALRASADRPDDVDVPERGPGYPLQDIRYGTGTIDILEAVEIASTAETVRGTVTNSTGAVPAADVWSGGGTHIATTDDGVYTLPVFPEDGLLNVTVERFGHSPESVSVPVDGVTTIDPSSGTEESHGEVAADRSDWGDDENIIVEMDPTDTVVERGEVLAQVATVENVGSEQGPARTITYEIAGEVAGERSVNPGPGEQQEVIVGFYNTGTLEPDGSPYEHTVSTPSDTMTANVTVEPADNTADVELDETVDVNERVPFGPAQPPFVATQEAFEVPLSVANLENYTAELGPNSTVDPDELTVVVEGEEYDIGEPIAFEEPRQGNLTVTIEVGFFAETGALVELEHVLEGVGDERTLVTGPTEVDDAVSPPQFEVSELAADETLVLDDGEQLRANATITNTGQRVDFQRIDFVIETSDGFDLQVPEVDAPVLAPGESTTVEVVANAPADLLGPQVVQHGFRTDNETHTREAFYLEPETSRVEVEAIGGDETVDPGEDVTVNATVVNLGAEGTTADIQLRFDGETIADSAHSLGPGTRDTIDGTAETPAAGQYPVEAVTPAETVSRLVGVGTPPAPRNVTFLYTQGGLNTPELLDFDARHNLRMEPYLNIENEQTEIEDVLATSDVVLAHDMLDTERAQEFAAAVADDPLTGAVYLEQAGEGLQNSDAISVRSSQLGVPASVVHDTDSQPSVAYEIETAHPIFDGVADPGESVPLYDDAGPLAGFELLSPESEPLATVTDGDGDSVPAAWVTPDSGELLLSSIAATDGFGEGVDPENYTDAAGTLLTNAVTYTDGQLPVVTDFDIAGQGPNATLLWGAGGNATVSVTSQGELAGPTDISLSLVGADGDAYTLTETVDLDVGDTTEVTFEGINDDPPIGVGEYEAVLQVGEREEMAIGTVAFEVDVTGDGNPATDTTGDGRLNDVRGDEKFNIFDVQALFNHLDSDAVQNSPEAFNFNRDEDPEEVSILDVQGLFDQLAGRES